jgi:hypothetical protein
MKIISLLSGIHTELKRLNENLERYPSLGENAAIVAEINAKAARLRNNPLLGMSPAEMEHFKDWIADRLKTRNLTPMNLAPDGYRREDIESFIEKSDTRRSTSHVRDIIAKGLGYQDFLGLYEDYKRREGGAA